ncbi:efflux RND transporter periplasmic adaptor subunit [Aestuariibacter sp. AA17]|uniref:Efflux RND transporter periplasmic adaptor subunit n=1 Tax=Fluctibacter corallii TaxID=2984329 RepID=A0ABT3ACS3_9ALTE|nr:efflux RND transporter periplasmic adaptor subunit [Aestuariibacter sp. AA17]MCV2886450.1 efflux RND transporter periplasmic adaptor subunit [Aestuariibacter sp. AA17]
MNLSSTSAKTDFIKISAALLVPFIGLVALLVFAGDASNGDDFNQAKLHQVNVVPLEQQQAYQQQRIVYGNIEARRTADLGFEFAGKLASMNVDEGYYVKAGDVLAELDSSRLQAQLNAQKAAQKRNDANEALAVSTLKRVEDLSQRNLDSKQRLDESRQQLKSVRATREEINANIQRLQVELEKSQIRAPFDGYVVAQYKDAGSVISPSAPIITLREFGELEARFAMPMRHARTFSNKNKQTVHYLNVGEKQYAAKLKSASPNRNLQTRTVDVIFTLDEGQDTLLPGDLIALAMREVIQEKGFWVPKSALNSGVRGLWTLYTVADTQKQQVIAKSVELLYSEDNKAFVRGTFTDNELVVVSGVHRLVPNQMVVAVMQNAGVMAAKGHYE